MHISDTVLWIFSASVKTEMVANEKILVTPLAYIRGRSLSNVIFIVDEAQNLTPHEARY